jgi:hypothetical protein
MGSATYNAQEIATDVGNALKNVLVLILSGSIFALSAVLQTAGQRLFVAWDWSMDKLGRKRIILDRENKEPYLVRYYLLFRHRDECIPFNIFIHKFIKGDDDHLHDHPWGYFTYILSGGYSETVRCKSGTDYTYWRQPGFYQTVPPNHIHKIDLDPDTPPCWTLFVPFRRSREWGFIDREGDGDDKWVAAEEYLRKLRGDAKSPASHSSPTPSPRSAERAMQTRSQAPKKSN